MKENSKTSDSTPATTEAREIKFCIQWLQTVPTVTRAINYHRSSYGYKHDVEAWTGCYISNDSFVQGARQMGLMEVKQPGSTQNYCYNLRVPKAKSKI